MKKRKSTKTSSFGMSARLNHDSSKFYKSKLYDEYKKNEKNFVGEENIIPKRYLNKIFCKSSEIMKGIPNNSVHLMITSPPYNVGKEYDRNLSLTEYLGFLKNVMKETYRVLVEGGRACINVANVGRKPYIPLHSYIINLMIEIGFSMKGEIIWNKNASAGTSTAWGSWKSAASPTLRDIHEYIIIFSKGLNGRKKDGKKDTITKDEFLEFTKSIWEFPSISAKRIGHPAPFPEELPRRLIQLYSFENDVILDPFIGSGQTALAALKSKRNYIGYDIKRKYCQLAKKRISGEASQTKLF